MKKLLNEIFIKRIYYSLAYLAFIPVSVFVLALASIVCLFIGEDKVKCYFDFKMKNK